MRNELYEIIYLKYRNLSRSIACETIQDLDLAEDIAQEVFKKFYEKMDTLDLTDEEHLRAWIINASYRKAIDFARKAYRHHEFGIHEDGREEHLLIGESPEKILERREEIKEKVKILAEFRKEKPLEKKNRRSWPVKRELPSTTYALRYTGPEPSYKMS